MKLDNKYIIGTHIMFYEIEMVPEFIQSLLNATKDVENKNNITVDLFFNLSEFFEKVDTTQQDHHQLLNKFMIEKDKCIQQGLNVKFKIYQDDKLYTIGDYRRDLNYHNCNEHDFIIWGESDCLVPKEIFNTLENISSYANQNNINRYITTFATRKMWDESWSVLEHVDFEKNKFYDMKDEGWKTDKSSIWYTMTIEEMNKINSKSNELDIRILNEPKFDGSLLVISSDLIKSGVNIPHACYACGEDASFEKMCKIIMGKAYVQFVVKNILKVHNRVHPLKREYVQGEKNFANVKQKRKSNSRWQNFHQICEHNLYVLGTNQTKFKTVEEIDV